MADSKIEWTERSDWNPVRGCTRVSPGCGGPGPHGGCYAEVIAARFSDPGQAFHGFAERTSAGGRWTGRVELMRERLTLPLGWRKPSVIFANSTSDFFHKKLDLLDVAQIFGVAIAAHHLRGHTTQILTKRPDLMRDMLTDPEFWDIANTEAGAHIMERVDPLDRRSDDARATCDDYDADNPPPGIWLGVSVEDQARADERREAFRAVPAQVRFVSYEPALGPVDWDGWEFLDWIISGGESGPRARPSHPDWHRKARDFCAATDTAYLFKQWGEYAPYRGEGGVGGSWMDPSGPFYQGPTQWPPASDEPRAYMVRYGKKAAGRLLDGVTHDGMPG